jgi:hypothetical protein
VFLGLDFPGTPVGQSMFDRMLETIILKLLEKSIFWREDDAPLVVAGIDTLKRMIDAAL